jgi:hypothetical protein
MSESSAALSYEVFSANAAAFTARLLTSHSAIQLFTVFAVSRSRLIGLVTFMNRSNVGVTLCTTLYDFDC